METEMTSANVPDKNKKRSVTGMGKFQEAFAKKYGADNAKKVAANADKKDDKKVKK